jgi:AMP-polyphosphate phosphotransferase
MSKKENDDLKKLQLKMLRIQQGVWHCKDRVIIALEGMDAAGKGGAIRRITENLDPRNVIVYPIGAPDPVEQGKHYLYRFWTKIPSKGTIAIFDRTWYGRVLVERVEKLIKKPAWERAYDEINQFEKLLIDDGIKIVKIYLRISKKEQMQRFEDRLRDPYKQWKITEEDIRNRAKWNDYKKATDDMIRETDTKICPWHIVDTDDKDEAREMVLEIITKELKDIYDWMEDHAHALNQDELKTALEALD